jgi:tetratricopeptide (TPR) repeat protein
VVALAQWRRESFPNDPFGDYVLAAAHYRAGQYREATECLKSLPAQARGMFDILGWYIRAMAEQRLGHADEARQWLDRGEQWWVDLAAKNPGIGADFLPVDWPFFHRLELQFLRKEAAELIHP